MNVEEFNNYVIYKTLKNLKNKETKQLILNSWSSKLNLINKSLKEVKKKDCKLNIYFLKYGNKLKLSQN